MEKPANRSFRLRGTRMTHGQEIGYAKYWGEFGLPSDVKLNPQEIFPNSKLVVMEIGTGMGEATAEDRKSTRLNSSHMSESRMPSSA